MRTWPPGVSWYSSERAQLTASGPQRGTVTAIVPPGRSTRDSSLMAATSSGMCSSTSEAITRSKVPSGNGSASASPCTAVPGGRPASSPASTMAPKVPRTWATSSGPASSATTAAPAAGRLEGVTAEPAAEVEEAIARLARPACRSPRSTCGVPLLRSPAPGRCGDRAPPAAASVQQRLVAGRRAGRRHLPGESADHPLPAGGAQPGPQRRVVEERAMAPASAPGSSGGTRSPVSPSVPRPRAARPRWWPRRPRRRPSPRWPAGRTPRRARAPRPPRPRRRGGPARRR